MKELGLTDLIDTNILQQFQDAFSGFTGMAAVTADEKGYPVTKDSGATSFCTDIVRGTELGRSLCAECCKNGAVNTLQNGRPVVYRCHAGLTYFSAPIMVNGRLLGIMIGGQVRTDDVDRKVLSSAADDLGIDTDKYISAAEKTSVRNTRDVENAAEFLYRIAKLLSDMALSNYTTLNQNKRLEKAARSQSAYIMNMSLNMEKQINALMSIAKDAVDSGDKTVIENSIKNLIDKSSDVHSMVGDTVDYIRMTGGHVELNESVYELSSLIDQIRNSAEAVATYRNISFELTTGDSLPQFMLGDTEKIEQMLEKFINGTIYCSAENSSVKLEISCHKHSYASMLTVDITSEKLMLPENALSDFESFFSSRNHDAPENDTEFSYYASAFLLKLMSGTIKNNYNQDSPSTLNITIPQLEVRD